MIGVSEAKIEVLGDPEVLSRRVAGWLFELAVAKEGTFAVCLSGGSTPQGLYERLAEAPYLDAFPWSRTHWFWGDERFVPHDDALSNYRMAREALLSRAPVPANNIHAIPTEGLSPEMAAAAYQSELKSFYGAERLDPRRAAVRCESSWAWARWTYGLVISRQRGVGRTRQVGRCRCWRQARSADHADLSYAREQPACGLPRRGRCRKWRYSDDFAMVTKACRPRVFIRPARCGCLPTQPRSVEGH